MWRTSVRQASAHFQAMLPNEKAPATLARCGWWWHIRGGLSPYISIALTKAGLHQILPEGTISPAMCLKLMMNPMESHGLGVAADIANAKQRIKRTELAPKRTEEMTAENIALGRRMRSQRRLVEAASRLVKIDPPKQ